MVALLGQQRCRSGVVSEKNDARWRYRGGEECCRGIEGSLQCIAPHNCARACMIAGGRGGGLAAWRTMAGLAWQLCVRDGWRTAPTLRSAAGPVTGIDAGGFVDAGQLALVRGIHFTRQRGAAGCAIIVFAGCRKGYLTGVRPALTMNVQMVWLAAQTLCPKTKMTILPVFRDLRWLNFQVLLFYFPAGAVLCLGPATGDQHGG